MPTPGHHDMTLNELFETKLFQRGARVSMWIAPFLFAGCAWFLNDIRSNTVDAVAEIRTTVSAVVDNQGSRAADNERFQANITGKVTAVDAGLVAIDTKVDTVQLDVATMKGILVEMQRRDLAQTRLPFTPIPTQ